MVTVTLAQAKAAFLAGLLLGSAVTLTVAIVAIHARRWLRSRAEIPAGQTIGQTGDSHEIP